MDGKVDAKTDDQKEEEKKVGAAAKEARLQKEQKAHDLKLYRKHGEGLDTGNYELVALVTHKGRSADGGHYISWVH